MQIVEIHLTQGTSVSSINLECVCYNETKVITTAQSLRVSLREINNADNCISTCIERCGNKSPRSMSLKSQIESAKTNLQDKKYCRIQKSACCENRVSDTFIITAFRCR